MDNQTELISIKDTDLTYIYVNDAFLKPSPFDNRKEVLGSKDQDLFPTKVAEIFQLQDRKVLTTRESDAYEDFIQTWSNSDDYYILITVPILNDEESVIGIKCVHREINEQIRIRNQMKINLDLVEMIMDTISFPIFVKDLEGVYQRINQAYADDLELDKEEIIGKTDFDLFDDEIARYYRRMDEKVKVNKTRLTYFSTGTRPNQKYLVTKDVIHDEQSSALAVVGIVNTYQDIKEVQEELVNRDKFDSISQLAGGIAHDLNNILTSVLGMSSILALDETDPERLDKFKVIDEAVEQAARLIDKIKTFAQQYSLETEVFDINTYLSEIIRLVKSNPSNQDIKIEYEIPEMQYLITADITQFSQLFLNLLINGIESMENGGHLLVQTNLESISPDDEFLVQPQVFDGGEYVSISISDEGGGIPKYEISKIFDPYYTTKDGGTGLGLAIVYGALLSHNGLLKLETTNTGSTFTIYLPHYTETE